MANKNCKSLQDRRPAIERALDAFKAGGTYTKHTLAELLSRDPKNAQRVLYKMHRDDQILYICGWTREHGSPVPTYKLQGKRRMRDVPAPQPLTCAEKRRKRRAIPEVREKEAAIKRWSRSVGKHVNYGFWGI